MKKISKFLLIMLILILSACTTTEVPTEDEPTIPDVETFDPDGGIDDNTPTIDDVPTDVPTENPTEDIPTDVLTENPTEDNKTPEKPVEEKDQFTTDPVYNGSQITVSSVETNSNGTHLLVDGKPFLYLGASIRVDAFMNCDKFSYDQVKLLFAEASKLGVTCVQIPLEWNKIELEKDQFDYTYIRKILLFALEYNLKVEFLWYGTNMCGDTHSYTVPDYILRDGKTYPKFDALRTGEFWNYYGIMWFLDFDNPNLVERETNALAKAMDYIYQFDSTHGGKKPVIGIQVLNEPDIFFRFRIVQQSVLSRKTGIRMTAEEGLEKVCNSLNALGMTVKNSKYKVYTRVNLATATRGDSWGEGNGIYNNQDIKNAPDFAVKFQALEGIDIVGDDCYTSQVKEVKGIVTMFKDRISNNFGHIAENDGSYANTASLILTSIANHGGYSIYDLITSPFFVGGDTSKNVDQGIILFKDNKYNEFIYKAHYGQTQSIIKGLKLAGGSVYGVSPADFMAFNIHNDNPVNNVTQTISSTNVRIVFKNSNGAIGFAIDHGSYMDVYFTGDSNITISNGTVSKVLAGSYDASGKFVQSSSLSASTTLNLKGGTLYRIEYRSSGKIASNTWGSIGLG